jgi:hypothetical protein
MCPSCKQFSAAKITSGKQLQDLHQHRFFAGVQPGVLTITYGI